ncbi:MAG TPA: DMT family transporter [Parafilimonas sp.]|nr:DMT family transporter [Parafilimonas sp.]
MYDICENFFLNTQTLKWLLFSLLALIWGSSFILMKIGLQHLNAFQVASIRILSAGLVMLPFAISGWRKVPGNKIITVIIAGLLGNFCPAFLYCIAEIKIDSALTSILNALTPLCAIIIGIAFFKLAVTRQKVLGVVTGFIGLVLLPVASEGAISFANISYASFVLIATICYGTNVHVVNHYLKELSSIDIASIALSCFIPPCILILVFTGFFHLPLAQHEFIFSVAASFILGALGTALASVWFYTLVKTAGSIFASLVTYGIPFIAVLWGLIFGEHITVFAIGCLLIILAGVYIVNRKSR